jgi:hypothetical protein
MKELVALRLPVLILTTIFAFAPAAGAAAEVGAPESSESSCKSIVGSWELVAENGAIFFGTYNGGPSEGTVNFTSPNNTTSLTHGAWKRIAPCTFADTDIAFIYGEDGNATSTIKFRAEIELGPGGDTALFAFEFEVSLLDGTVVATGASTATGTRINVEPRRLN